MLDHLAVVEDTEGNKALMHCKESGKAFNVVRKHGTNKYEFLGKWRVEDYIYDQSVKPYRYIFDLIKAEITFICKCGEPIYDAWGDFGADKIVSCPKCGTYYN